MNLTTNALIEAWKIVGEEAKRPEPVTKKIRERGYNEFIDYDEAYRLIKESFEKKE